MKNNILNLTILNFNPFSIYLLLFLCLISLLSSSCSKDDTEPDLVPITMSGENTMGFYVNGVPHNKRGKYGGLIPIGVSGGIQSQNILRIFGGGGNPGSELSIYIPIDSLDVNKEYPLNKRVYKKDQVTYIDDSYLSGNQFETNNSHTGKIKILKIQQDMASGTFYFDALNPETGKVIKVTDGRFDIKFF